MICTIIMLIFLLYILMNRIPLKLLLYMLSGLNLPGQRNNIWYQIFWWLDLNVQSVANISFHFLLWLRSQAHEEPTHNNNISFCSLGSQTGGFSLNQWPYFIKEVSLQSLRLIFNCVLSTIERSSKHKFLDKSFS